MIRWLSRFYFLLLVGAGLCLLGPWEFKFHSSSTRPEGPLRTLAEINTLKEKDADGNKDKLNLIYDYLVSEYFQNKNQHLKAIGPLEKAAEKDPESSELRLSLAETYLKLGKVHEGVESAKKAVELDPENREALLMLINLNLTAKKYESARELLDKLLKKNPLDEEALLLHVLVDVEDQKNARAHQDLLAYLKRDPASANGYFYLGRLEQSMGNTKKAIAAFERAMELRPSFVQAATYLAFLLENGGNKQRALELYRWLADETDEPAFHKKLGTFYLENKEYEKALSAFKTIESKEPEDLNNTVKVALILIELKQFKEAAAKLKGLLKQSPDSDNIRFYLAALYEQLGEYKNAIDNYKKVPRGSKLYMEAVKGSLFSLKQLKKTTDVLETVNKALKDTDGSKELRESVFEMGVQVFSDVSKTEKDLKALKEAENLLENGLTEFPDSARLLYLKATLLERKEQSDEAIKIMEQILKKSPDHVGALNFVGYTLADKEKDLARAERYIRKAIKLRPKDPYIMDSLGWVLFKRGRLQEAHKTLTLALSMKPDESIIADHLGDVLVKLGQLDEAKQYYEKAIELGPEKESDRKQLEKKLASLSDKLTLCEKGALAPPECNNKLRNPRRPSQTNQP
jgi:tetratricopeptide (TPR) repeat protein